MDKKLKILFLCTGNSCRSQMAEGWARHLRGDMIEAHSAGVLKTRLNPHAVEVMAEKGIDISGQYSKEVHDVMDIPFDYVVTVCGHAHETCPVFPGNTTVVHRGFDDPPSLTARMPDGEEKLNIYRRVRDEIEVFIASLPDALEDRKTNEGRNAQ